MKSFAFGGGHHERLEVVVEGYERPETGEYYDDNWLSIQVAVHAGGFRGRFHASILIGELLEFHQQLSELYRTLTGSAEFRTLEGQLSLDLTADAVGHIQLSGVAEDRVGLANRLEFTLSLDQTQLQGSMQSLGEIVGANRVRT